MANEVNTRKEILDLLAKGKITAVEAAEMLSGASQAEQAPPPPEPEAIKEEIKEKIPVEEEEVVVKSTVTVHKNSDSPRWLRVRVRNLETGKNKVSVNLPFGMFKFGFNMARNFTNSLDNIDIDEMAATLKKNDDGMLVEVQDEESNEQVQIFLS